MRPSSARGAVPMRSRRGPPRWAAGGASYRSPGPMSAAACVPRRAALAARACRQRWGGWASASTAGCPSAATALMAIAATPPRNATASRPTWASWGTGAFRTAPTSPGPTWPSRSRPSCPKAESTPTRAVSWATSAMERDLYANNPANGQRLQRFGAYDLDASNLQALAAADWRLAPGWTLLGSLQWSQLTRDAASRSTAAQLDQQWNFATPKIGLNWAATPTTRLWANLSRSQEAPTFWEIVSATVAPNSPATASAELVRLKMQSATTLELGGQGRWGEGAQALHWTAAVYRSVLADELISTTDANGIRVGTYNYRGGTRHQGIEAGLSGSQRLGAGAVDFRAAWTYSDFRFRGGEYAGKQIAGVPRHLISAEALYRLGAWRFGPSLRWMPVSTPTDHANTPGAEQEAYALLGLKLEWREGPWAVFLQADNVTDRRYASSYAVRNRTTAAQPGYLPGLGRSVTAGLTYQF